MFYHFTFLLGQNKEMVAFRYHIGKVPGRSGFLSFFEYFLVIEKYYNFQPFSIFFKVKPLIKKKL